jgi:hypothetical protein
MSNTNFFSLFRLLCKFPHRLSERSPLHPSPARSVTPPRAIRSPPPRRVVRQVAAAPADSGPPIKSGVLPGQPAIGSRMPPAEERSAVPAVKRSGASVDKGDAVSGRRCEKRKLEGGESLGLPPIKLKLSLRPVADDASLDSQYKVKPRVLKFHLGIVFVFVCEEQGRGPFFPYIFIKYR